ncbi:DUF3846 domain-containing protein [Micromonospora sp. NPDC006766]|uniref:DUF3846 domain-containing protein n=1 Tax=Micromonospora sp. NPDC006766 TaxID=3154778 RepID=UPI0033E4AE3E
MSSNIIDAIDQAIADTTVSLDAMRSVPGDADGIRVVVIPADEDEPITLRYLARDENGSTLRAMQATVGGYVDVVRTAEGVDVWINDEGLLMGLPFNERATAFVHAVKWALATCEWSGAVSLSLRDAMEEALVAQRYTRLVGPAIISGCNDEGETVSVPDVAVEFLQKMGLM